MGANGPVPLRPIDTCLILCLGQLFLELFHPQSQLLDLCLVLLHAPIGVSQLGHLLLELLLEFAVHVLQICQLLQGWGGSGHQGHTHWWGPRVSSEGMSHLLGFSEC